MGGNFLIFICLKKSVLSVFLHTLYLFQYLSNPGSKEDRRRLLFDLVCVCLLTPSTLTVVSLCIYGASNYSPHRAEFAGLVLLGTLLLSLFIVWLVVGTCTIYLKLRLIYCSCANPENFSTGGGGHICDILTL